MYEYEARKIEFKELLEIGAWRIKVYTISKTGSFDHDEFYKNVKSELVEWLSMGNSFDASNDRIGFLILHAGTEGIFSLVNWWVGKNMLNTHIFLTDPAKPRSHRKISGDGLSSCIWELEVIYHERTAWMKHVLKHKSQPQMTTYLKDVYNGMV